MALEPKNAVSVYVCAAAAADDYNGGDDDSKADDHDGVDGNEDFFSYST